MQPRPRVVVFDVNETLSDMTPLADRFADVGAPELLAKVWFASLLRDGFALAASNSYRPFKTVAAATLFAIGCEDKKATPDPANRRLGPTH